MSENFIPKAYENLFVPEAEVDFVYGVLDALEQCRAEGHQALALVPADALLHRQAKAFYVAMGELVKRGEAPELELVRAELFESGALKNREQWHPYLEMFGQAKYVGNPIPLGQRVIELWQRRQAMKVFAQAARGAADLMQDHREVIFNASREAVDLMAVSSDEPTPAGDDILELMMEGKRFAIDQEGGKLAWFGIDEVDANVQASAGNLVIVAARPGKGKTAFVIQALSESATDRETYDERGYRVDSIQGQECLFVSLELPKVEVEARLASWHTLHRSGMFWAGKYESGHVETIMRKREALNRIKIWAQPSQTPWSRIESKIRGAVLKFGTRVVVIDYFGLIGRPSSTRYSSDHQEAAKLSGAIRALAQSLNICIILLCQLNRNGAEGEPTMEDLRDTGQLEQDAQTIMALYGAREAITDPVDVPEWMRPKERGEIKRINHEQATWLKLMKNRNGQSDLKWQLLFDGALSRFERAKGGT